MHIGERLKALKLKMLFVNNIEKCNGASMVFNSVSTKCRLQTADCRLQTGYKLQTRYKMQTADCRLGIKCRLRPKLGINCRLRAKLSFRAVGDIFSSLTHPCRVIAFLSSFPRNFLSIYIDCEQSMSTDRLFFCVET